MEIRKKEQAYLVRHDDKTIGAFPSQKQAETIAKSIIDEEKKRIKEFAKVLYEWTTPEEYGFVYVMNENNIRGSVYVTIEEFWMCEVSK